VLFDYMATIAFQFNIADDIPPGLPSLNMANMGACERVKHAIDQ